MTDEVLETDVLVVGSGPAGGRRYTDLYDDWSRLRELAEDGCVLVRPDAHVAWRAQERVADPAAELRRVLCGVLSR